MVVLKKGNKVEVHLSQRSFLERHTPAETLYKLNEVRGYRTFSIFDSSEQSRQQIPHIWIDAFSLHQHQFSNTRQSFGFWIKPPFFFFSFLSLLLSSRYSPQHALSWSHSHTTPSPCHAGWLISPGLWASAWQRARRRKSKREQRQWGTVSSQESAHIESISISHLSCCLFLVSSLPVASHRQVRV